ncbi:50S ribosomal protein L20 [bacterium]|nr:50S ribosomal protein L20 [bacterium]
MTRVKRGYVARRRRKRILKLAKGYFGSRSKTFVAAKISVFRALKYAYHGRKRKKRDFRRLWITRINAATKLEGFSYSRFMHGLKLVNINLNRNILAQIAVSDPTDFSKLVEISRTGLAT